MIFLLLGCTDREADSAAHTRTGDIVSVVETATGRILLADDRTGSYEGEICLSELAPTDCPKGAVDEDDLCQIFSSEHFLEDGESSWLISYVLSDTSVNYTPGRLTRFRPTHPPEVIWEVTGLSFAKYQPNRYKGGCITDAAATLANCNLNATHTVLEDGDQLVVADTNNSRVLWLEKPAPGFRGPVEVIDILDEAHPSWGERYSINNVQRLTEGDRELLLTTFKSARTDTGLVDTGSIVLWDVTDTASPELIWVYPPEGGFVAAVHHGQVQQTASGEEWLIYSHSLGASEDPDNGVFGSVGMARYNGTQPPEYLADGVLGVIDKFLGFVREVEIPPPYDWLLITDSGCENPKSDCALEGRVVSVSLPELEPEGQSGGFGDQRFVSLTALPDAFQHEMVFPYEADLLQRDAVDGLVAGGVGNCE
ncbi:MAG: hypothetical protein P8R54_33405 [Myxococcota bacterium]|nr:hypothetical protein [Myxococcota bacterium]